MRGVLLVFLSISGVLLFSIGLLSGSGFFEVWFFLELVSFVFIPMFFFDSCSFLSGGVFNYLVVSSISSSFIVAGLLCEDLIYFFLLGLFIKFGIFPFCGWVYMVLCNSNWWVVWSFSTLLKVPVFLIFCFFNGCSYLTIFNFLFFFGFLFFSLVFWVFSVSWLHCWCSMMLSSSISLVCVSFVVSLNLLVWVFFVYFIWASFAILLFFYGDGLFLSGVGYYFFFCVIVLSFPFSFGLFYKFVLGFCMFSCASFIFCGWVVYSISEQIFFLKYLIGGSLSRCEFGVLNFV